MRYENSRLLPILYSPRIKVFCSIISGSYCCTRQSLGVAGFYVMYHGSGLSIIDSFRCFVLLFQDLIAVQGSLSVLLDSMLCTMAVGCQS